MEPLITEIFQNKKSNPSKLTAFGFSKSSNGYIYRRMLDEIGFQMEVFVDFRGEISAKGMGAVIPYSRTNPQSKCGYANYGNPE